MTGADDIVARLREMRGPNVWEAADEIERLRAALKPLSCKCGPYKCVIHGDDAISQDTCMAFNARAALAGEKSND